MAPIILPLLRIIILMMQHLVTLHRLDIRGRTEIWLHFTLRHATGGFREAWAEGEGLEIEATSQDILILAARVPYRVHTAIEK